MGVPFSNLKFTYSISGFGTNGVSIGQFEFDLYDKYGQYSNALLEDVEVHLEEKNSKTLPSRKYYISKRSVNDKICHFTAYDIAANVDQDFNGSFDTFFDRGETAPCGNVLSAIQQQCGFTSIGASDTGLDLIRFTKEQVTNRTCRAVLEDIAKAMCGVWIATRENGIRLSCFGNSLNGIASCDKYSKISYQGRQKITKLICINSDTGDTNILSTGEYGTVIQIESPFVAAGTALDSTVWNRIKDYIYQAWNCEKALISPLSVDDFPPPTTTITFGSAELKVGNVTIMPGSAGIFISAGTEPQDEEQWKYDDYITRTKIGVNQPIGNMTITNTGRIVYRNLNK